LEKVVFSIFIAFLSILPPSFFDRSKMIGFIFLLPKSIINDVVFLHYLLQNFLNFNITKFQHSYKLF
jgi:hypothetical protein